jgi:phosphate:Na+ symporter
MKDFQIAIAAVTSIILFVFSLENFSREIQRITGEKFRKFLGRSTRYSMVGVIIGAVITAFIQSSSATSVIAISLVNAGVLSFKNSIGIIFGSNIGTTVTAQLVAFKLTSFAPAFIILGFALNFFKSKYSVFAKALFYFGFVFFTLNLISSTLTPLQSDQRVISFLTAPHGILVGVLVGIIVTALIQSSSVTTGLAVIFTQQGMLSLENAIPILMGANIGTTVTALLSIISMDLSAKKTALAHFLFNVGGVLLFLPLLYFFREQVHILGEQPVFALANFHLIFNVVTSLLFVVFLNPFARIIDKIMGEGKMDFERIDLMYLKESENQAVETALQDSLFKVFEFIQENYNLVTLSIETNYKNVLEVSKRRIEYLDYVKSELLVFFSNYIGKTNSEKDIDNIVKIIASYEYLFQIHDSVKDLSLVKDNMEQNFLDLKSDLILIVRELSSKTLSFFGDMSKFHTYPTKEKDLKKEATELQRDIDEFNKDILKLMSKPNRSDAGILLQIITYNQRLKDKLVNYHKSLSVIKEIK